MLKLDIYENGRSKTPEKTVACDEYTISYGILQDILEIEELQSSGSGSDTRKLIKMIGPIVLDIFPELDSSDIRKVRLEDLMDLMADMVEFAGGQMGVDEKNG